MNKKIVILIILTAIAFVFGFIAIASFKGGGESSENEDKASNAQKAPEVKPADPTCMCGEEEMKKEGLTFSHFGPDATIPEGKIFVWDRPDGYEFRYCAYDGKVKLLFEDGDPEFRIQALKGNPRVEIRYYTKSTPYDG